MNTFRSRRRSLLQAVSLVPFVLGGTPVLAQEQKPDEKEVLAVEDLMREHGVLRRILLLYSAAALRLRGQAAGKTPAKPLNDAATLFRAFGEQYHERQLEEDHVFPMVERGKGDAARYAPILKAQHDRGRAITDYIVAVTRGGSIGTADRAPLAKALDAMVWMYRRHTAIEDTIVFPAWKETMSGKEYEALSDKFEELEQKMFGKDGFEDAVKRIAAIEQEIGLSDLAKFTAPRPPSRK